MAYGSGYDKNDNRPLPIGINKKVIEMFKDELVGKIMIKFCALRQRHTHFYWMIILKRKEPRVQKKCIIKRGYV